AVSNDMFELKVTGAETEDCKYIISDDAITKKFPEISMACEDIDGTEHYTNNNPNGVPNLSPDEIAQENGFTNAREINSRCYNNNDEAACSLLQENPDLIDEQHGGYLCNFKNKDWACSELCDRDNFISCNKGCALNDDDSCNRISEFDIDSLTKEELTILNSICYNNQKDAACSILQEQPDLIDDRYGNYLCNYQAKDWACSELCDRDNFISCNKSCGFANDESCNKMSEFDTSTLTDSEVTALNSTCYNNQKDVACSMLQEEPELIDDKYGGYLCNFQSKEWACSELCSRDSFSSCSKSCGLQNDDSCNKMGDFDTSTLSASDITALNSTCYNNRKDVACSMLQNEPDLMEDKYGGYLCTYQSKDWACQEMCSRGDTSSCNKVCGSDSCR
ncbi:MAG: hypothetical protein N4A44_00480, partial [Alphaproteobacteria bacterium]|nr:hypothetical protein [Alphaproteobacteria bacterium]